MRAPGGSITYSQPFRLLREQVRNQGDSQVPPAVNAAAKRRKARREVRDVARALPGNHRPFRAPTEQGQKTYRILLVEDDVELASMMAGSLASEEFYVSIERRGDSAIKRAAEEYPDAVVLDFSLPALDGSAVCEAVREIYRGIIIAIVTGDCEIDKKRGLWAGADDCVAKPVLPHALLARLRTHLCRVTRAGRECRPIVVGSLVVDAAHEYVAIAGTAIDLGPGELDLLHLLAKNAGRTVSREDISEQILGTEYNASSRSIDLRVSRVRKKIGDDPTRPHRIKSVKGVGYMLSREQ